MYCVPITFECNWNCQYCIVDTHNKRSINDDEVLNSLNSIKEYSKVTITGGEPGLVDDVQMRKIFDILIDKKSIINVTTNGLFLKRYNIYYHLIDSYIYHCSENLIDVDIVDDPNHKVQYTVVIDDNNIKNLKTFINFVTSKNIYVRLDAALNIGSKSFLSKKNIFKILKEYKQYIKPQHIKHLIGDTNDIFNSEII